MRIILRVSELDNSIVYVVIDNGCGMDYGMNVFITFFTTRGLRGGGLGLLMTRKIIRQLGGNIDSVLEQGTRFWVTLPRD